MTDNITLTREELNALIDERVKSATKGLESDEATKELKRVTERHVEIRMIDGKAVIGFKNRGTNVRPVYIYEMPDKNDPKNYVTMVDLILEGGKEITGVDFKQFRQESVKAKCRVLETINKEWVINQGTTMHREAVDFNMVETGYEVPVDIVGQTRTFEVEIPRENGGPRKVLIAEAYVNIA